MRRFLSAPTLVVAATILTAGGATAATTPIRAERLATQGTLPMIALAKSGDVVAVWANGMVVQSSFRPAHASWDTPVAIASATWRFLDVDAVGNATLLYEGPDPVAGAKVFVTERPRASGLWSGPRPLSGWQRKGFAPGDLDVNAAGDAIAAFGDDGLKTVYRPRGEPWQAPQSLATPLTDGSRVAVALDQAGNAFAVWVSSDPLQGSIYAARRSRATGSWSPPVRLVAPPYSSDPRLAVGDNGDAFVTWIAPSFVGIGRGGRVSMWSDGVWSGPVEIGGGGYVDIRVAIDDDGTAVLAGVSRPEFAFIRVFERPVGGTWTERALFNLPHGAGTLALATGAGGTAAAGWLLDGALWVARKNSDGTWTAPAAAAIASAADIALTATGDVIVGYAGVAPPGSTTPEPGVFAGALDVTPPQIARVVVPMRLRAGVRARFSVAASDEWSRLRKPVWQFGDGVRVNGSRAWHTYPRPGKYDVVLVVSDAAGNAATRRWRLSVRR